jgi:hypothetical protein
MTFCNRANRLSHVSCIYKYYDGIEADVMYNSKRGLVLCHDYDHRDDPENNTLQELVDFGIPLRVILDIKVREVSDSFLIVDDICKTIKGSRHLWDLCSFNELCVRRLLDLNLGVYKIGLISCGLHCSLYTNLDIDFVSLDYAIAGDDLLRMLKGLGIEVYIWGIKAVPDLHANGYIISNSGRAVSSGLPNVSQSTQTVCGSSPIL